MAREELAAFAPSLSPADPSVPLVSNAGGEVVTSGGLTSGIDASLRVLRRVSGTPGALAGVG